MNALILLLAYAGAQCCGPTWIRDAQTSKSLAISAFTRDGATTTYGLVNATGPTTVRDLQYSLTIALQRTTNGATSETTQQLPPCGGPSRSCCDTCARYYTLSLYVNLNAQADFQIVPLTDPANYYDVLASHTGLLQCFCDKDVVSYSTLTDSLFQTYFPDGIQLNAGDSIDLVLVTNIAPECTNSLADGLQSLGTVNFIYSYPNAAAADADAYKHVKPKIH
jgi:hypothetical protein